MSKKLSHVIASFILIIITGLFFITVLFMGNKGEELPHKNNSEQSEKMLLQREREPEDSDFTRRAEESGEGYSEALVVPDDEDFEELYDAEEIRIKEQVDGSYSIYVDDEIYGFYHVEKFLEDGLETSEQFIARVGGKKIAHTGTFRGAAYSVMSLWSDKELVDEDGLYLMNTSYIADVYFDKNDEKYDYIINRMNSPHSGFIKNDIPDSIVDENDEKVWSIEYDDEKGTVLTKVNENTDMNGVYTTVLFTTYMNHQEAVASGEAEKPLSAYQRK